MGEIDVKMFAAELVKASVEGQMKRKRSLVYEQARASKDLFKLWNKEQARFVVDARTRGNVRHSFQYKPRFTEYEPTVKEIEESLPDDLKDLGKERGFNLLVECEREEHQRGVHEFKVTLEYSQPVVDVIGARVRNGDWP
jgi:hypothetical protein